MNYNSVELVYCIFCYWRVIKELYKMVKYTIVIKKNGKMPH